MFYRHMFLLYLTVKAKTARKIATCNNRLLIKECKASNLDKGRRGTPLGHHIRHIDHTYIHVEVCRLPLGEILLLVYYSSCMFS